VVLGVNSMLLEVTLSQYCSVSCHHNNNLMTAQTSEVETTVYDFDPFMERDF